MGNFCKKICCKDLSKIPQSGHITRNLEIEARRSMTCKKRNSTWPASGWHGLTQLFRINFKKVNLHEKNVPGELVNSETLRMVRDMDEHKNEEIQGTPPKHGTGLNLFRQTVQPINQTTFLLMLQLKSQG